VREPATESEKPSAADVMHTASGLGGGGRGGLGNGGDGGDGGLGGDGLGGGSGGGKLGGGALVMVRQYFCARYAEAPHSSALESARLQVMSSAMPNGVFVTVASVAPLRVMASIGIATSVVAATEESTPFVNAAEAPTFCTLVQRNTQLVLCVTLKVVLATCLPL
jgi:hypothetical protein